MHKPRTYHHRLAHWLLVLVIAFAPLQGAFSTYDDACKHDSRLEATETGSHASTGNLADHEKYAADSAQDCCQQDCNCNGCAGVCGLVQALLFLPSSNPVFFNNSYHAYEPQLMAFHIGRAVPTLFRPPRTFI